MVRRRSNALALNTIRKVSGGCMSRRRMGVVTRDRSNIATGGNICAVANSSCLLFGELRMRGGVSFAIGASSTASGFNFSLIHKASSGGCCSIVIGPRSSMGQGLGFRRRKRRKGNFVSNVSNCGFSAPTSGVCRVAICASGSVYIICVGSGITCAGHVCNVRGGY